MSKKNPDSLDDHYSRLILSINQNQCMAQNQDIQSFYSSHYKSTIRGPKLTILNIQSLTEKERDMLIQGIKKLQPKISVEFVQTYPNQKNRIQRKQKVQECQEVKSKPLYPSLQIKDPKELSYEFKVECMKEMLQKKTIETAEMSKRLKELEIQNEELKIERRNMQEPQDTTTKILLNSFKEEVNTMVKGKIDNWQLQKQELQRNYKFQIQKLSEKYTTQQIEYLGQIAILKDKLKQEEIKQKDNQMRFKQQKSMLIKEWQNKKQILQNQLDLKRRQAEAFYLEKQNLTQQVQRLDRQVHLVQFRQVKRLSQLQQQVYDLQQREKSNRQSHAHNLAAYKMQLQQQNQERQRDAQMIDQLQEKLKSLEEITIKTKLQCENQNKKNKILQDKIKQFMEELSILKGQQQKMLSSYKQLQKENQSIKKNNEELTIQRQRLYNQISQLKRTNQERLSKIYYLQRQVQELKNVNKDVKSGKQMFTGELQQYKRNLDKKDETIKQLKDKNKKFQQELRKNRGEYQVMFDKVERQNHQIQNILKSQSDSKQKIKRLQQENKYLRSQLKRQTNNKSSQSENQLKKVKMEKDKLQHQLNQEVTKFKNLFQETKTKVSQLDNQLKTIKIQKERLQQKLQQEVNKNKFVKQESTKVELGNLPENEKVQQLQKIIQKYQHDLKKKNQQRQHQKHMFEENMRMKQVQLAHKKAEVNNLNQQIARNQQRLTNAQIPQRRQDRLNLFFELLRGFRVRMTSAELASLRSKIGFIMN